MVLYNSQVVNKVCPSCKRVYPSLTIFCEKCNIKLLTIPVLFGEEKSFSIINRLNILGFLFLFCGIYFNIPLKSFLPMFLIFPYSFYYISKFKNTKNNNAFYFLAAIEPVILLIFSLIGIFLL